MKIPTNITDEHLKQAIEKIDKEGIPPGAHSTTYDVFYKGKKYPPKLIVSYANFFANGETLNRDDFHGGPKHTAFKLLDRRGFKIYTKQGEQVIFEREEFFPQLKKFLDQSKTADISYGHYGKQPFRGMKVKASFGKGNQARIPWIAFLGEGESVQKGIYPVFQLYKDLNLLVLAYGISETNKPDKSWDKNKKKTIKTYFQEKGLGTSDRYENSYIFKAYDLNEPLNEEEIEKDINLIIDQYKKILDSDISMTSFNSNTKINSIDFDFTEFERKASIAALTFNTTLIARFIASLVTKPFVILTGLSGSGKTKLAQAFATWICENENQFCIVPVGADWTNREPLLGYSNAIDQREYVKPENGILDLLIKAKEDENNPHFIILDEMNLSHVERYFADFLSIMETGEDIVLFKDADEKKGIPARINWPKNVFIVGTVNIDETTYMFSPKVLDRANTIEFRITAEEMEAFLDNNSKPDLSVLQGKGANMAADFLKLSSKTDYKKPEKSVNETLLYFFIELKKTGAEFGYRSGAEIHQLLYNLSVINNDLKEDDRVDIAIMQKLLPKLHGSRRKLVPILKTLGQCCLVAANENIEKEVFLKTDFSFISNQTVRYPLTLEKLSRMYNGVIENGFASYAEA